MGGGGGGGVWVLWGMLGGEEGGGGMDCLRCGVGCLGCSWMLGCFGLYRGLAMVSGFLVGRGEEAHVPSLLRRVLGVLWETAVRLAIYNGPSGARV